MGPVAARSLAYATAPWIGVITAAAALVSGVVAFVGLGEQMLALDLDLRFAGAAIVVLVVFLACEWALVRVLCRRAPDCLVVTSPRLHRREHGHPRFGQRRNNEALHVVFVRVLAELVPSLDRSAGVERIAVRASG